MLAMTSNANFRLTDPVGRTFIFSGLITMIIYVIMGFVILNNKETLERSGLPGFMGVFYTDKLVWELNLGLTIFTIIMFSLAYLFMVLAWGSLQEMRNYLPSWGTIFGANILNFVITWFMISLTVGEAALVGSAQSSEITNYTGRMRWIILLFVVIFQALITVYLYYTEED